MKSNNLLVLGSSGQIGSYLKKKIKKKNFFLERGKFNYLKIKKLKKFCVQSKIRTIINCAAYTNVDLAEIERKKCKQINHLFLVELSKICYELDIFLIHFSTDFVFDGKKKIYFETDKPNPINYYGKTKLDGERAIIKSKCQYLILRVSWLYSKLNNNFPKKIIKLFKKNKSANIVADQFGSPTSVRLIYKVLVKILKKNIKNEIFHLSCKGKTSWYSFAKIVLKVNKNKNYKINKIKSSDYLTKANRPQCSYLSTKKISKMFKLNIPYWKKEYINFNKKTHE